MHLEVKKLKEDLFTTPGRTLSLVPVITFLAETNYSFPPVKEEDYENLFQNVLL